MVLYCIVLQYTVLYCIIQYYTVYEALDVRCEMWHSTGKFLKTFLMWGVRSDIQRVSLTTFWMWGVRSDIQRVSFSRQSGCEIWEVRFDKEVPHSISDLRNKVRNFVSESQISHLTSGMDWFRSIEDRRSFAKNLGSSIFDRPSKNKGGPWGGLPNTIYNTIYNTI